MRLFIRENVRISERKPVIGCAGVFREIGLLRQGRGMRVVKAAVSGGTRPFLLLAN
jgi:hypothetical protein